MGGARSGRGRRLRLSNGWRPRPGEGASERQLRGNLLAHLEPLPGRGAAPRQKHNGSLVDRHPSPGEQRSFGTAEPTRAPRCPPSPKRAAYINLAGCWIMLGRGIYEVEKSHGEAKWLSNQMGGRKGTRLPGRRKWREPNIKVPPGRNPGPGCPRRQAWDSVRLNRSPRDSVRLNCHSVLTACPWGRWCISGARAMWELSAQATQVCSEPKTALNNKTYFLKCM